MAKTAIKALAGLKANLNSITYLTFQLADDNYANSRLLVRSVELVGGNPKYIWGDVAGTAGTGGKLVLVGTDPADATKKLGVAHLKCLTSPHAALAANADEKPGVKAVVSFVAVAQCRVTIDGGGLALLDIDLYAA